jgi:7-cyano-7-deazaguanine synthase
MSDSRVLVVLSGGLDSTTLAYDLQSRGWKVDAISFDYGQKHGKELEFAKAHAHMNNWDHVVVDMTNIGHLLSSALIDDMRDVPEGHYAAENMKATIVPNRNAIMMAIACGVAVSNNIPYIATAVHGGDHFIYPDCRPEFITALSHTFALGNEGFVGIQAPFIRLDKNYIAQRAVDLDYDWEKTWSCYKGGAKHCGKCGTCVERMEAIWSTTATSDPDADTLLEGEEFNAWRRSILFPPSLYEDNKYWIKALEGAK